MSEELSFSAYLKSTTSVTDMAAKLDENMGGGGKKDFTDHRLYSYKMDATDNCIVLLRFLPSKKVGGLPYVHRIRHEFKDINTNRWLFETCPTHVKGAPCPICTSNSVYFRDDVEGDLGATRQRMGIGSAEEYGRKRSRKKQYFANVYIIKDSVQPQNNGKIFIWKFGPEVYNKIQHAMKPDEKEVETLGKKPIDPSHLIEGCNFVLNLYKHEGQVKYDRCEFQSQTPLLGGDQAKLEQVWKGMHDLSDYEPEKTLQSAEKIQERLDFVSGRTHSWKGKTYDASAKSPSQEQSTPKEEPKKTNIEPPTEKVKPVEAKVSTPIAEETSSGDVQADDGFEDYFK